MNLQFFLSVHEKALISLCKKLSLATLLLILLPLELIGQKIVINNLLRPERQSIGTINDKEIEFNKFNQLFQSLKPQLENLPLTLILRFKVRLSEDLLLEQLVKTYEPENSLMISEVDFLDVEMLFKEKKPSFNFKNENTSKAWQETLRSFFVFIKKVEGKALPVTDEEARRFFESSPRYQNDTRMFETLKPAIKKELNQRRISSLAKWELSTLKNKNRLINTLKKRHDQLSLTSNPNIFTKPASTEISTQASASGKSYANTFEWLLDQDF